MKNKAFSSNMEIFWLNMIVKVPNQNITVIKLTAKQGMFSIEIFVDSAYFS